MRLVYAVIDTNVFVSALVTPNGEAPTVKVFEAILKGDIVPLYHADIIAEYEEVLHRAKFKIDDDTIKILLNAIIAYGVEVFPTPTGEILVDMDDIIFYEVAMEKRSDNSYLVTGNKKHYPIKNFIVTPAEMMAIVELEQRKSRYSVDARAEFNS